MKNLLLVLLMLTGSFAMAQETKTSVSVDDFTAGDHFIKSAKLNTSAFRMTFVGAAVLGLSAAVSVTAAPIVVGFGGIVIVGAFVYKIVANHHIKKAGEKLNKAAIADPG